MRFKLENEIGDVDTEQEYSSAPRNDQKTPLTDFVKVRNHPIVLCGHKAPVGRDNNVFRGVIRSWNHKGCVLGQVGNSLKTLGRRTDARKSHELTEPLVETSWSKVDSHRSTPTSGWYQYPRTAVREQSEIRTFGQL